MHLSRGFRQMQKNICLVNAVILMLTYQISLPTQGSAQSKIDDSKVQDKFKRTILIDPCDEQTPTVNQQAAVEKERERELWISYPGSQEFGSLIGSFDKQAPLHWSTCTHYQVINPTESDLAIIEKMDKLVELNISLNKFDQHLLDSIRKLKRLKNLELVLPTSLLHLLPNVLDLGNVTEISVSVIPSRDAENQPVEVDFSKFPSDDNIRRIKVSGDSIKNTHHLAHLRGLRYLQFDVDRLSQEDLSVLSSLELEELGLFLTQNTNLRSFIQNAQSKVISILNPTDCISEIVNWSLAKKLTVQRKYSKPEQLIARRHDSITLFSNNEFASFNRLLELNNNHWEEIAAPEEYFLPLKQSVAHLKNLKVLNLEQGQLDFTKPDAEWLSLHPRLEYIGPVPQHGADGFVQNIRSLQKLRSLLVWQSDFGKRPLPLNIWFPNLSNLKATNCEIDNRMIPNLNGLPLTELSLSETELSGGLLKELATLKHLRSLDLSKTKINDLAMVSIAELTELEDLNLAGTNISATGIAQLKKLEKLKALNLSHTSVAGLPADTFSQMNVLKSLDLSATDLTDRDISAVVNAKATRLNLSNTLITKKSIELLTSTTDSFRINKDISSTKLNEQRRIQWLPVINATDKIVNTTWLRDFVSSNNQNWQKIISDNPSFSHDYRYTNRYMQTCGRASFGAYEGETFGHLQAGLAHMCTNQYREAIKDFTLYLDLYDGSSEAHASRGLAYLMISDYIRAELELDRAIYCDPLNGNAHAYRAELMRRMGQIEKASTDKNMAAKLGYHQIFPCERSFAASIKKSPR